MGGEMSRKASEERNERLALAVGSNFSVAGVLRALQLKPAGGNYLTVQQAILKLGLDTSHWTGRGHRRGATSPVVAAKPLQAILRRGTTPNTSKLRRRLIEAGLFEPICSDCGLSTWQNANIPLELDHRDGDRTNNLIENLRLLCPNCHALTPNYRGRNIGRSLR